MRQVYLVKQTKILFILILFFTVSANLYGQSAHDITVKIIDTTGKPILSGRVELLRPKDSVSIKSFVVVSDNYLFKSIPDGSYILKTSSSLYANTEIPVTLHENLTLQVVLKKKLIVLTEVKIVDSKKLFTNYNGNLKVNVANSILAESPSPVDLLSKLPSIQLSADNEKLSIVGRGEPLIYLDNQRITMDDLRSMSTKNIKNIEIINNPSAKYEAEGRSVILITSVKNHTDGLKIDLTENFSWKRYFQNRNSLIVNYKKNKLELKGNIQYNDFNLWESNSNDFNIIDKNILSDYRLTSIGTRKQFIFGGGLYYQFDDSEYFSVNANKRFQNGDFTIKTNSVITQQSVPTDISTDNYNNGDKPYFNVNFNYDKKFKKINSTLFVGVQYAQLSNNLNSNIFNDYDDTQSSLSQIRNQGYHVNVWSERVDFEKDFTKDTKWESGISLSSAQSNSLLDISNFDPNNNSESIFKYSEKVYAAYSQLSGKINQVTYSAGLRLENTVAVGDTTMSALLVNKNYVNLFPKVNFNIPIKSNESLNIGYSESIIRPNYSAASQITTYINPFFEWSHNIDISPTTTDEISAVFQLYDNSLGLSVYKTKNPIFYGLEFDNSTNVLTLIDRNYQQQDGVDLTLTVPLKSGLWSSTNVITASLDQVKDPASIVNNSKPYFYLYSNNQFKLPGKFTFIASGWDLTKRYEGIFQRSTLYAVDFGLSKRFLQKFTGTLNYYSLLASREAKEDFNINNIVSNGTYYSDVREFAITLSYSFGAIKNAAFKNKAETDVNDRMK